MSVLDMIAEKTRERVIAVKAADPDLPDRVLRSVPHGAEEDEILPFEAALRKQGQTRSHALRSRIGSGEALAFFGRSGRR